MKLIQLSIFTLIISLTNGYAQEIDPQNSKVEFEVGNIWINTVDGTIQGMKGKVNFDPESPGNKVFDVCIDPSTIETGVDKRNEHLRSEDFFYVEKYPKICFKSSSVKVSGDGYSVTGNLTIRDVTKQVTFPFTYNNKTLKGSLTLNRKDYNIGKDISNFTAKEEVEVTIICSLK